MEEALKRVRSPSRRGEPALPTTLLFLILCSAAHSRQRLCLGQPRRHPPQRGHLREPDAGLQERRVRAGVLLRRPGHLPLPRRPVQGDAEHQPQVLGRGQDRHHGPARRVPPGLRQQPVHQGGRG
jgi:hypothetical protein